MGGHRDPFAVGRPGRIAVGDRGRASEVADVALLGGHGNDFAVRFENGTGAGGRDRSLGQLPRGDLFEMRAGLRQIGGDAHWHGALAAGGALFFVARSELWLDEALTVHGLVKMKFTDFKEEKKTLAPQIAERTGGRILTGNETGKEIYGTARHPKETSRSIVDWLLVLLACLSDWLDGELARRSPGQTNLRAQSPSVAERPIQVVPTGLSGRPPPGPAMPLMLTPMFAPSAVRTPRAISITVSRLTAPFARSTFAGTPRRAVFAEL